MDAAPFAEEELLQFQQFVEACLEGRKTMAVSTSAMRPTASFI